LLFTALVLVQMPHMFNIRSEGTAGWRLHWGGNRFLVGAVAVSIMLQLGVIYTSIGNELFETNPIAAVDWLALILITAATVVFVRTIVVLADARNDEGAN